MLPTIAGKAKQPIWRPAADSRAKAATAAYGSRYPGTWASGLVTDTSRWATRGLREHFDLTTLMWDWTTTRRCRFRGARLLVLAPAQLRWPIRIRQAINLPETLN